MKKVTFLFIFTLLLFQASVRGQSDAQISQYMFFMETYNPSVLTNSNDNTVNLVGLNRWQWVGIPNAPQTTFFAINAPISSFLNQKQGLGIAFVIDKLGIFSSKSVNFQYALRFKINDDFLSCGLNAGFVSQVIYGDSVHQVVSDYHVPVGSDLAIPSQTVTSDVVDFGVGATYLSKYYYIGLSVLHLFEPILSFDDYVKSYIGRTAYFTCGYTIPLDNSRYIFKPSMLIKSDFISFQTDLSFRVEKDSKYWAGLSWRLQDAIVFFAGVNFMNGLFVGYSYDLSTTRIIAYSFGSHEILLRYNINIGKNKLNKYKSVRIL